MPKFYTQARNQITAAAGRPIEWHFAEKEVADYVRAKFAEKDFRIPSSTRHRYPGGHNDIALQRLGLLGSSPRKSRGLCSQNFADVRRSCADRPDAKSMVLRGSGKRKTAASVVARPPRCSPFNRAGAEFERDGAQADTGIRLSVCCHDRALMGSARGWLSTETSAVTRPATSSQTMCACRRRHLIPKTKPSSIFLCSSQCCSRLRASGIQPGAAPIRLICCSSCRRRSWRHRPRFNGGWMNVSRRAVRREDHSSALGKVRAGKRRPPDGGDRRDLPDRQPGACPPSRGISMRRWRRSTRFPGRLTRYPTNTFSASMIYATAQIA